MVLGPIEVLPGGFREAPEKILRQKRAFGLPHKNLPGHGPQRRQLGGPSAEDPSQLGPGGGRGSLPGRSPKRAPAAEDKTAHLLWRPDVSHWGSQRTRHHLRSRPLRNRTEVPQGQTHRPAKKGVNWLRTKDDMLNLYYSFIFLEKRIIENIILS